MSRRNRTRAMECICGPGKRLSPGDKLALLLIGDLTANETDTYWESQSSLAERMGTTRRSAGRAVRSLVDAGALTFIHHKRVGSGATVKVYGYTPEGVGCRVGESFPPEGGGLVPSRFDTPNGQMGRSVPPSGKLRSSTWEGNVTYMGRSDPQTGREPTHEQKQNRVKLAGGNIYAKDNDHQRYAEQKEISAGAAPSDS